MSKAQWPRKLALQAGALPQPGTLPHPYPYETVTKPSRRKSTVEGPPGSTSVT